MATKTYTYVDFAEDVVALTEGMEFTAETLEKIRNKAFAFMATQTKKAEYNATHPKKSSAKGASEKTVATATAVRAVLSAEPMTGAEIAVATGLELTALQVANACKYIEGVTSCKVIRDTVTKSGLKAQKEYTAYTISR